MKRINLISLARCPERQEAMIRQFSTAGLEYRYIEAVDGRDDIAEDWEVDTDAFSEIYGRDIKAGEVGCYASHLKALDTIVGTEADYGIVMEDDVVINDFTAQQIGYMTEAAVFDAPDDWSMIYPGNPLMWGSHRYKCLDYTSPGTRHQDVINKAFHSNALEELDKALIGTQCYIISVEFAHHVLTHWNTIYRPIDEVYRILCHDARFRMFHVPRANWWCKPNFDVPSEING